MKTLIIFLIITLAHANPTTKQEVKTKTTSSPVNTIQQSPKYEMIYKQIQYQPVQIPQQQQQPKAQYIPIQILPKPYYVPHAQPQAMIIIAQPALVPQSLLYNNPTQQLLNYFHANPQAKYQLLHGNYQQVPAQTQTHIQTVAPSTTYMQPVAPSPVTNYVVAQPQVQYIQQYQPQQHVAPQYQQVQHVPQYQQAPQYQQPQQLSNLAHLAQIAAQQYVGAQMKSTPAIVTGFENFTPEQQAQIKAQLSNHLGGNYHAVGANQYSSKYTQQENNDFVPSPQVKNEATTETPRYLKAKN